MLGPRGAKAKGATAERELAAILTEWATTAGIPIDLMRNLEQTRSGGHDLVGTEPYGIAIEVKRVEALAMPAWWRQAVRQAATIGCSPVLAWRQNRKPWRFRVMAFVWPCNDPLVLDMCADEFRKWFLSKLVVATSTFKE